MVLVTPTALVAPPVTQPREYGLFSVFNFRPASERFEQGVGWVPEGGCDPLDGISAANCNPEGSPEVPGEPEIQTFTIEGPPTTGTWTVSYHGVTTAPLAITATAADIQAAINAVATNQVTVTGASPTFTVTSDAYAAFDLFTTADTFDIGGVEVDLVQEGQVAQPAVPGMVGIPKTLDGFDLSPGEALPFTVYADWLCSPVGYSPAEAQREANLRLLKWEQTRAEQAFWTGDLLNTPNLSGANGYPAPISAGTHDTVWDALAAAELGIAQNYGGVGVLHMSVRTASLLTSKGGIQSKGGRLFTDLGTPIVAGAGYPDVPEIIGTPAVFGYRSDIFTSSDRAGDLFDRAQNNLHAIAERTYLVGFDPCPIVKATYTGIEPTP